MNDISGTIDHEPGPSWARPNWPVAELDELNLGLDPTQASFEAVRKASAERAAATGADPEAVRRAADDSIRAMMLIRTYRVRGHLAARLDPLGLHHSELPADLTPEYHGFTDADLDRPIYLAGALGFTTASVRQIVQALQSTYCGHIGFEYMHINDLDERRFIQERIELGGKVTAHAIGADQHHRPDRIFGRPAYRLRVGGRRGGFVASRRLHGLDRRLGRIEPEIQVVELGERPVRPRPARAVLQFD